MRVHVVVIQLEYTCIKIISNETYLMCDARSDDCLPRSLCYFSFFNLFFNFHLSLKLFLICSYFSDDLSLTVPVNVIPPFCSAQLFCA